MRSGIEILRNRRSLAVVAGMKKLNDHKKTHKKNNLILVWPVHSNLQTSSYKSWHIQYRTQLLGTLYVLYSQYRPAYPSGQSQKNSDPRFWHRPPFRHWVPTHGSNSASDRNTCYDKLYHTVYAIMLFDGCNEPFAKQETFAMLEIARGSTVIMIHDLSTT